MPVERLALPLSARKGYADGFKYQAGVRQGLSSAGMGVSCFVLPNHVK